MQIERVEIQVIGPETERQTWSEDLPFFFNFKSLSIITLAGLKCLMPSKRQSSFELSLLTLLYVDKIQSYLDLIKLTLDLEKSFVIHLFFLLTEKKSSDIAILASK